MGLKIKWNDNRVRDATTAILLVGRDRLGRGHSEELIRESLAEYRNDPDRYKENRAGWPGTMELGPLTKPAQVARYKNLVSDVDQLLMKWAKAKRQFNSLLELDNALVTHLQDIR